MVSRKLLLIIFFIASLTQIHGDVMKISNFTVIIDVDRDPQHIIYNITLQNMVDYPLVPGIVEFRLQKQGPKKLWIIPLPFEKEVKPLEVKNLKGYYSFDGVNKIPMKTYVEYYNNYSIIKYEIWEPIERRSNITIFLEYDTHILEDGILFKTLSIPVGSNMDIEHLNIKFITNRYSKTYQYPSGDTFKVPKDTLLMINAEFSILPLPKLPTYGYLLFWLSLFLLVFLLLVYEIVRSYGREDRDSHR
ncbi:MAG TPA: hypothetical protein EYH15_02245 [Methanothermococcus okinawensis]|uniref:Uncharacterized protein n=1 Tax=Methanothermococcus okinawensis TaxID=155863 RepID=A0A832ZBW4_9EURY|nr:hypothetical protein [Methanococcaceae archaeon]HIP84293.1 hypothetical protein [Methanothermococcus okinawensis]HIP91411.1 hypothetical protein [Methanothermococcus okinawensis]